MLKTTNIISNFADVPNVWIYENYITLPEALTGQDIKMRSIFGTKDENPSFYVYYSHTVNRYKWKDFSTGKEGDGVELVKELFNLPQRFDASAKIMNDYNAYVSKEGPHQTRAFTPQVRYKFKSAKPRNWTESDVKYWMPYKIGSVLLEKYGVLPLESFTLTKDNNPANDYTVQSAKIYAFCRKNGDIYKIYQPLMRDRKFFKISDYIQGSDQLTFKVPYLVICSSLKDGMSFSKLNLTNAEWVAPDSENVIIPEHVVRLYQEKYKGVCTLFDNDEPGINAMIKYKKLYNLSGAHLKLEKDLADDVKTHGVPTTRELLYPILTQALTGTAKQL